MSFKTLNRLQKFSFSKTICIVAGGPHMDLVGSKIIRSIKQASPETRFIGIGGQRMIDSGLDENFANVNDFLNKPLYPIKNFKHKHIERPVHPVFGFNHAANRKIRDQVDKNEMFKDILEHKPVAFLSLSNDFFMNRLYNFLNDLYDNNNLVKPPVFHYDRTHINQRQEFTEWLDHQFSVNPLQPVNYASYTFPSTVVGFEGVGRAYQYLYQQSSEFAQLVSGNHIYLQPENHQHIIEQLVAEERVRFRDANGLTNNQHVIFFSPGNTQSDLDFSVKRFQAGFADFLQRPENRNLDRSYYALVVNTPSEDPAFASQIEHAVKNMKLPYQVQTVFTTNKYSAMAGSDAGIVYNGEAAAEAVAMQLPIAVIENMPFLQHYFMQMYNNFNFELNIAARGEICQELIHTAATPFRISEELQKMTDPKFRYYVAKKFSPFLYNMVPRATEVEGNQITQGDQTFVRHGFTYDVMTQKILRAADAYHASDKNIPHYKINDFRANLMKQSFA